jgi:uncharacterized protein YdaL
MMKRFLSCFFLLFSFLGFMLAQNIPAKNVLVLVEGDYNLKSIPTAEGRQLAQLLGHFNTKVTLQGINAYQPGELQKFDYVFYIGYSAEASIPTAFMADVMSTSKNVIWINTGFAEFSAKYGVAQRFGFSVTEYKKNSTFGTIKNGNARFSKGTPEINLIQISDKASVNVWATALSSKPKAEVPYMVKSRNLVYVADLPFTGATETDRYLLFCEKLHDILGEKHPESHQAILRIEDVTPMSDPDKLRDVADILSERGIPFLVGVVPIFVNPGEDRRVTLTERPEVVDALKYMVRNGGSIVMHGVTHQYKGISTDDCEFWDGINARPIAGETSDDVSRKIEMGIDEFFKNGLYPIAWETPHYQASMKSLDVISKFFSTVVEQRMVIDNFDYGQYFPYIINKDLYGQRIYPENLGYVPLSTNLDTSRNAVKRIIRNADAIRQVHDGVVSCFFHPFLNHKLLTELVDGIQAKGFTFVDLSSQNNWVKTQNKIILTGSQTYKLALHNSFLHELYFDANGNVTQKKYSTDRINGEHSQSVKLNPGELYVAEGLEYYAKQLSFKDKVVNKIKNTWGDLFEDHQWHEIRVNVCWNQAARGAAYNDQSSLVAMFKSLNINVDTIFLNQDLKLSRCNLLVVPYSYVDSLSYFEMNQIVRYVKEGGHLMTDRKNKLAEKLGIKFLNSEITLREIRDMYFPQEYISWKYSQLAYKFAFDENDEIFCQDIATGLPVAIGRQIDKGKIIYFNTAFDPTSQHGYSNYPFAMLYVKRYLDLMPVVKRENLEVYFDPGLRPNTSIENVVKLWVKQGIRIVHVAAWHQYPKYEYDYKRLVKLAHANGILVYAWFEPPQVSLKFYQNHPEWHEKNYKGEDVRPSWRYPVALNNPQCLAAVIAEYVNFLKSNDWDGANLGELYFEAGRGFEQPNLFTPMSASARHEFKTIYGFDMKEVFDTTSASYWKRNSIAKEKVVDFRVNKIAWLHEQFLKAINDFSKTRSGFGVMVTFMDTYMSPEIREYHGVSSDRIVDLQKKYGFLLQAEDPQNKWSTSPFRYTELGSLYAKKMSDPSKLLVDLNILSFRKKEEVTSFPTLSQTGIESYELIHSAALGAPRFTVYSEASCNAQDLALFSYASSSPVKYEYTSNGYSVSSPYSFVLQLPEKNKVIKVDDQIVVGYRDNSFLIPAGTHIIDIKPSEIQGFSTATIQPQLLSITGNLLSAKYDMRQVSFTYESQERTIASFTCKPTSLKIDGQDAALEVLNGNDCFSVMLPAGHHSVDIIAGSRFTYGMNLTSLWSVTAIAIYGTLAVILLFLMYIGLKVMRRKLEK